VLTVSEAATNASCVGSCNIHLVKVAAGVQGGRIETTICDQAPRPQRSPDELLRAWAVADRAVGRRVAPCESPLRDAGDPPRCISCRCARSIGAVGMPSQPPATGNTRLLESPVEREVDATPARQSAACRAGKLPATLVGRRGGRPPRSLERPHDGRSASGGHL
jgi:hypothetical protein